MKTRKFSRWVWVFVGWLITGCNAPTKLASKPSPDSTTANAASVVATPAPTSLSVLYDPFSIFLDPPAAPPASPPVTVAPPPAPPPPPVVAAPPTPPPPPCGTLLSGRELRSAESITSCNGAHTLTMQSDGKLVLVSPVGVVFTADSGFSGSFLRMQEDGNLVLYVSGLVAKWSSGTYGHPGATLSVQDDGNLVIYEGSKSIWNSGTYNMTNRCAYLESGRVISTNQRVRSCNGRYELWVQGDGNAVLYGPVGALFATGTNFSSALVMQTDGNLVLYSGGTPIWTSGTNGNYGAILAVQDDGNMVIYHQGRAIWDSHTYGLIYPCGDLPSGKNLTAGQRVQSCNGRHQLVMQSDGNLVLYSPPGATWLVNAGNTVHMQTDGNLVLYSGSNGAWTSNTYGHNGARLRLQDDGNLVIYDGSQAIWTSDTYNMIRPCARMNADQGLHPGERLSSCNGKYALWMQRDGNLVLYQKNRVLWATSTNSGVYATIHGDGNFVLYNAGGKPLWYSNTGGHPGSILQVQDDGNLVIYHGGNPVWATNTH